MSLAAMVPLSGAMAADAVKDKNKDSGKDTQAAKVTAAAKPVIGINCDVQGEKPRKININNLYIEAIEKAGGIPLLLPPMSAENLAQIMPQLDGVMMIGGDDYPPELYGAKPHASVSIMEKSRSDFDMALVKNVIEDKSLPFMGICAGSQALNIGAGGTLIQDIPSHNPKSEVMHASKDGWQKGFNSHIVELAADGKLAKILEHKSVTEPTSHHQCVDKLGKGLKVIASTADGVIEGIEMPDHDFVVGVQFHPERAYERNEKLFAEFIKRAAEHRAKRGQ